MHFFLHKGKQVEEKEQLLHSSPRWKKRLDKVALLLLLLLRVSCRHFYCIVCNQSNYTAAAGRRRGTTLMCQLLFGIILTPPLTSTKVDN